MKVGVIYQILNKINGKFYLGSSYEFHKRKNRHLRHLLLNKHHCLHLQRAYNKYGKESFEFIVLLETETYNLRIIEQQYLDNLKPEYNTCVNALAPMEGRKHSKETIEKYHSEETQAKYRKRKIYSGSEHGKYGKPVSQETKDKTSKPVIDDTGRIYKSITEAAKFHGCSKSCICDNLSGRTIKTSFKLKFKYYKGTNE